jgi:hypothetical protein
LGPSFTPHREQLWDVGSNRSILVKLRPYRRALYSSIATNDGYDISSMRWLLHAAAPCPVGIKRAMLEWWGPRVYE